MVTLSINKLVKAIGLVILISLGLLFFFKTRSVWFIVLIAYTFAYMTNPLVVGLSKLKIPRLFAVLSVVSLVFAILAVLPFLIAQFLTQLSGYMTKIPSLYTQAQNLPEKLVGRLPRDFYFLRDDILKGFDHLSAKVAASGLNWLELNSGNMLRTLVTLFGGVFQVGLIIVLMAFFLMRFASVYKSVLTTIPSRYRATANDLMRKLDLSVGGYFKGQLLVSFIVGLLMGLGMMVLRVPLAFDLTILAMIGNLIPFAGPIIVGVPAVLLALTISPWLALFAFIWLVLVNQIDAYLISPWVFSKTVKLGAISVTIGLLLGTALFGLTGAILAIPAVAFFKLLYFDYYLKSDWYLANKTLVISEETKPFDNETKSSNVASNVSTATDNAVSASKTAITPS
jgi:predicted PurR-regulated permease PerM